MKREAIIALLLAIPIGSYLGYVSKIKVLNGIYDPDEIYRCLAVAITLPLCMLAIYLYKSFEGKTKEVIYEALSYELSFITFSALVGLQIWFR